MADPNDKMNDDSLRALQREIEQLQKRLQKALDDRYKNSETLVNKLRRGLDAARRKEKSHREKLRTVKAGSASPSRERQLKAAQANLADARARTTALKQEMAEAQEAHRGFQADHKRQAERAKLVARASAGHDRKNRREGSTAKAGKARAYPTQRRG